ncbi:c-type cytochrome [Trinickia dinghuensis]|uniref:Cytochrome c n=1 Tax=Trinickia dinghuensis TaxID=2291023 RepID=A0A3D8JT69_9BURK|nr:cytochrome c [Trinickia dinghuensis]RDU96238.1 cytochrome c [Trinickia dinghuensis]
MKRSLAWRVALLLACGASSALYAAEPDRGYDAASAKQAWVLNCMGCHTADAHGIPGKVPPLTGELGHFVRLPQGREFVMRVPGASNSALSDADLANVLNWLIDTRNTQTKPANFKPYTAEEIAAKRRPALTHVAEHRAALVERLRKAGDNAVADGY